MNHRETEHTDEGARGADAGARPASPPAHATAGRPASRGPLRLGIVGCGAAAERLHLPAAQQVSGIEISVLVDANERRARELGQRFGIRDCRSSHAGLADAVDAVIVAVPNRLHAEVSIELLERGVPVLVEKPMATTVEEARAMLAAAARGGALLQVALPKRYMAGAQLIKQLLSEGALGRVRDVVVDWGENFDWPLVSGSGMALGGSGGGVLMDFGSHLLDLLCWWLGEPELVSYLDDARGGVEADCELDLRFGSGSDPTRVRARFSRIRALGQTVRVAGERFTVEWHHDATDAVTLGSGPTRPDGSGFVWAPERRADFLDPYVRQLESFERAVARGEPAVAGESVVPSLALIERCYRERRPYPAQRWEVPVYVPGDAVIAR